MARKNSDMLDILDGLESAIAYRFNNRTLLVEALTHSSFLNEAQQQGERDNERLEFFGDAVLDLFLSQLLLERFPGLKEGGLTRLRAALVGEENLVNQARQIGLGRFLRLGRGEEKGGGREKRSLLADAYEALLAAVYLDGGAEAARSMVERQFAPMLASNATTPLARDYKTEFQELAQARYGTTPRYVHDKPTGPDHDPLFVVNVLVGEEHHGVGTGRSKKDAEQSAAHAALDRLADDLPAKDA